MSWKSTVKSKFDKVEPGWKTFGEIKQIIGRGENFVRRSIREAIKNKMMEVKFYQLPSIDGRPRMIPHYRLIE